MPSLKTMNPPPNMSVEVPHTKNHFTRIAKVINLDNQNGKEKRKYIDKMHLKH